MESGETLVTHPPQGWQIGEGLRCPSRVGQQENEEELTKGEIEEAAALLHSEVMART